MQRFNRFLIWLWSQEGSPGERARGLAFGVFAGCFPLFGLQTLLGLTLASFCRGNHLLAVSGTWISNPITYAPLYWFNYRVGSLLLGHSHLLDGITEFSWHEIVAQGWIFGSSLILGSTIVGSLCSLVVGFCVYFGLKVRS